MTKEHESAEGHPAYRGEERGWVFGPVRADEAPRCLWVVGTGRVGCLGAAWGLLSRPRAWAGRPLASHDSSPFLLLDAGLLIQCRFVPFPSVRSDGPTRASRIGH